jgi:hypothetical protein
VASIALFIALGGTSYAAITALPKNSVGTKQIKNGAVTATKISKSAAGAVKVVGNAGAPAFAGSWISASGGGDEGVSFYKDALGIVHLQGNVSTGGSPDTGTIFTLPAGYRPAGNLFFAAYGSSGTAAYVAVLSDAYRPSGNLWFAAYGGGGSPAYIEVTSSGAVQQVFGSNTYIGLGNITFKAAS